MGQLALMRLIDAQFLETPNGGPRCPSLLLDHTTAVTKSVGARRTFFSFAAQSPASSR